MVQEIRDFLSDLELDLLEKTFHPSVRAYKRGEILPIRKSEMHKVFLLLGGTAYLTVEDASGETQILNYFVKGQAIYYSAMIQPNNGHCYVAAKYPCRVASLTMNQIRSFRQTQPSGGISHLPEFIFQSSVASLQQHCHILQQKSTRNKVLSFLHFQSLRQGGPVIMLPIPYSDLADYLAVDRSSLMKEIARMCQEGLIEKHSRLITLLVTTPYF